MTLLHVLILSLIEGITEFLPISSTGHLVLAADFLKITESNFLTTFEIVIQLGAILAIVFLYFKTLTTNIATWIRIIVAFIPTGIIGFTLYPLIKNVLLGNPLITVIALFLGGIMLIILELIYKEKEHHAASIEDMSYLQAFLIGLFQSLAVIPGVSRSGATIMGGLFTGAKRKTAVEFSFLLAIPTMAAASGLDLLESNLSFSQEEWLFLIVGFSGAFIVAFVTVKYFLKYITTHTFIPFGIYRIILSLVYFFVFLR